MKIAETFSDGEQSSWGRVGSGIALLFSCLWITILVFRVSDMSKDLPALAIFIGAATAFVLALYGASKAGDTIAEFKNRGGEPK